jgi:ankyrin repeat protein
MYTNEKIRTLISGSCLLARFAGSLSSTYALSPQECVNSGGQLVKKLMPSEKALFSAIRRGRNGDVRELIERNDVDVNKREFNVCTPLQIAVMSGYLDIVNMLIKCGADVNAVNLRGNTALHFAATKNVGKILETLLASEALPNVMNENGETPIMWAVNHNQTRNVELLLNSGAITNIWNRRGSLVPMVLADGKLDGTFTYVWNDHESPLSIAIANENEAIIELLCNAGARADRDQIPEGHIYYRGQLIEELTPNERELFLAIRPSQNEDVKELIKRKDVNVNKREFNGYTPLQEAAMGYCGPNIINMLIEGNADVNAVSCDGNTALHLAARIGDPKPLKALLASGALPNVMNAKGETPLMWAVKSDQFRAVRLLLDSGAIANLGNRNESPLSIAIDNENEAIIKLLYNAGARTDTGKYSK